MRLQFKSFQTEVSSNIRRSSRASTRICTTASINASNSVNHVDNSNNTYVDADDDETEEEDRHQESEDEEEEGEQGQGQGEGRREDGGEWPELPDEEN